MPKPGTRYDYPSEGDARAVAQQLDIDGYWVRVCSTPQFESWYIMTTAPAIAVARAFRVVATS